MHQQIPRSRRPVKGHPERAREARAIARHIVIGKTLIGGKLKDWVQEAMSLFSGRRESRIWKILRQHRARWEGRGEISSCGINGEGLFIEPKFVDPADKIISGLGSEPTPIPTATAMAVVLESEHYRKAFTR